MTIFGFGWEIMTNETNYQDRQWLDPDAEPFIQLRGVTKQFGSFTAVKGVDLDIYKGELFSLLGGSGCGKTTLLRMLAGFETPTSGTIYIDGMAMNDVPPYERPVNMMFQSYALFPHMTVESNVAYGLKRDGVKKSEIAERVDAMLSMVELSDFAKRKPHQLSGGQRQRVALARALVKRPKVLLLDEPLAALDKRLRERTQFELMNIQDKLGVTFIVVTHDQEEAMTLSTRIAVMDQGQFMQIGTPTEIYEYPETKLIANFIGSVNMFEGRVVSNDDDHMLVDSVETACRFELGAVAKAEKGAKLWVAVRPEKISMSTTAPQSVGTNQIKGTVHDIGYLGNMSIYRIQLDQNGSSEGGSLVEVTVPNQVRPKDGKHAIDWDDEVYLSWHPESSVALFR